MADESRFVQKNNWGCVLLIPASWKETQEIKSNPALMREIAEGLKAIQHGKGKKYASVEELLGPSAE